MAVSGSWAWESRRDRRQRALMEQRATAQAALDYVRRGDIEGAREVVRPRAEETPKKKGGGIFDKLGAGLDRITPEFSEDIGKGALTALDAPGRYVGRPLFGAVSGLTEAKRELDPETGQYFRRTASFADMGRGLLDAVTQDPRKTYREGAQAADEYFADPNKSEFHRVAGQGATDPLSFIGPGALKGALRAAPAAVKPFARLGASLLESPSRAAAGGIVGAATGAEIADRAGVESQGGRLLATLGGGLVGGGIGGGLTPERARTGLRAVEAEAGEATVTGLRGAAPRAAAAVPTPEAVAQQADDARLGVPDYDRASLFDLPEVTFEPRSRGQRLVDSILTHVSDGKIAVQDDVTRAATRAMRQRQRLRPVIESQAASTTAKIANLARAFDVDDHGRIQGMVGAPTLQDLAARLPQFDQFLTPQQRQALEGIRQEMMPWEKLRTDRGAVSSRADIMEGGFYLPRGRADVEGAEAPLSTGGGRGRGKPKSERTAEYDSMVQGIDDGKKYAPLTEAVEAMALEQARYTVDQHVAAGLKTMVDPETGVRVATTAKERMDPVIRSKWQDATGELVKMRGRLLTAEKRAGAASNASDDVDKALQRFVRATPSEGARGVAKSGTKLGQQARRASGMEQRAEGLRGGKPTREMTAAGPVRVDMPATDAALSRADELETRADAVRSVVDDLESVIPEDVDRLAFLDTALLQTARRAEDLAQRGGRYAEDAARIRARISEITRTIDDIRPEYQVALEKSRSTPRGQATIQMGGLEGQSFPEATAAAINKIIEREGASKGFLSGPTTLVREINGLMRALNATGELSMIGIQGAIGAFRNPVGAGKALTTIMQAMRDSTVIGKYLREFDEQSVKFGEPTSQEWITAGTRVGGLDNVSEFAFGSTVRQKGAINAVSKGIGRLPVIKQTNRAFGNYGDVMRLEMARSSYRMANRAGFDVNQLDTLRSISTAVNRATGWSQKRFAGDAGEVALFAPRFFQSQLEFAAQAMAGRGAGGLEARRSMITFLGTGIALSALMNELSDDPIPWEEFWQPMKDGRRNSNFLRFRAAGQDVSLFGPWDSLAGGIVASIADPKEGLTNLYRGKSSPLISRAWDVFTGKDYMGEPVTFTDIARGLAPFAYQEVGREPLPKTLTGLVGVKASPMSPTEELDSLARARFNQNFYDLEPVQQKVIKDEHPEVWERKVERGSKLGVIWEEVKGEYKAQQESRDALLLSGQMTIEDWQEARDDSLNERSGRLKEIYRDVEFSRRGDPVLEGYFDAFDQAKVNGVFNYDVVQTYLDGLSDTDRAKVERNTGLNATPLERLRKRLSGDYYELPRYRGYTAEEAREIDALSTEVGNYARGSAPYQRIRALNQLLATRDVSPRVVQALRRQILRSLPIDASRERFRRANPAADALLGRGTITPDAAEAIEAAL